MPLTTLWQHAHEAVCSLSFRRSGERISSGTGFKVGRFLVTNNHVIIAPTADEVVLRFVTSDGHATSALLQLSIPEFRGLLRDGQPDDQWDYAIIDLGETDLREIPSLTINPSIPPTVGRQVAHLGYHFDQDNLAIHAGIISSRFERAGVEYMQLDASVNQGNSGGPLFEPESEAVVGIVTRKATGLTNQFDALIQSFETNIQALRAVQGGIRVGGVDPMEALLMTQAQMRQVALEIRRSANVGIGYAYTLREIARSLVLLDH